MTDQSYWVAYEDGDIEGFKRLVQRMTNAADNPRAIRVEKNMPVYDGDGIALA